MFRAPRVVVSFVTCLPLLAAGCGAPPSSVAQAQTVATRWHTLGTWSGRQSRQTDSFDVTTGAMRLTWAARGSSPGARFHVSLHSAISGRPLQTIVERAGAGSGTTYLEDEPRVSYLVVESDQAEWTVTLDEAVPAAP